MHPAHPYGSSFARLLAFLVDSVLVGVVGAGIDLYFGVPTGISEEALSQTSGLASALKLIVHLSYWSFFESSILQATPGKLLFRLRVADLAGNRISFGRAFIRNLSKVLSFVSLGLGFLMIFVTLHNQCLHDKLAGTVVLKKQKTAVQS